MGIEYYVSGAIGIFDPKVPTSEELMDTFICSIQNCVILEFDLYLNNPTGMMVSCSNVENWKTWLTKYASATSMVTVLKNRTSSGTYYSVGYGNISPRIKV